MDGIEGMSLQGPSSYYLNRGGGVGGSSSLSHGGGGGSAAPHGGGIHTQPVFKNLHNPNNSMHQHVGGGVGPSVYVENPSPSFPPGMSMAIVPSGGEMVKKKRGRPRKYVPEGGANMSLALSPSSASKPSSEAVTPGGEKRRGRPPGSGWKQKLAPLGEWMNSSAGLAFTPHVLHIGAGEDIAAKILTFAQQKPRALCILSGSGSVSALTLRQPANSGATVTYEGRFEILCLAGSFLLSESGSPRDRTGGISISVCSPDGHMIGGAIGGKLIAANNVQEFCTCCSRSKFHVATGLMTWLRLCTIVVACSFVYGVTKAKTKSESETMTDEKYLLNQSAEKPLTPVSASPSQNLSPNSGASTWPRLDVKNPHSEIDLTRG